MFTKISYQIKQNYTKIKHFIQPRGVLGCLKGTLIFGFHFLLQFYGIV